MNSKYVNTLNKIHVPRELAEETLEKMELYRSEKHAYAKKRFWRGLILTAAAAASVCLLCTGVYAYTSGWLGDFLGGSSEKYESRSPVLTNVCLSCGDTNISLELDSAYLIDELLFYRLHFTAPETGFALPKDMSEKNSSGGFQQMMIGSMNTALSVSPWSAIAGTDGNGGFYMNCTLLSPDGFAPGDKIHLTPRRITYNYTGSDENFHGFNIITNAGFDIYFEIAEIPEGEKITVDAGGQAAFDSGLQCRIESITISPLCAVVRADITGEGEFILYEFNKSAAVFLENGEELRITSVYFTAGGKYDEVILFWEDDESLNPIDPKSVSRIKIGDLEINTKDR